AAMVRVRPKGAGLHTTQNRLREKAFLAGAGFPIPTFAAVRSAADLEAGLATVGLPAVLKSAAFGYDGKGQARIDRAEEAGPAWDAPGPAQAVRQALLDRATEP